MARNFIGWVSEHRSIMTTWVWKDHKAYILYRALVMLANWEDGTERLRGQKVAVRRGQIATSMTELAAITGLARKTVARKLDAFVEAGQMTHEATRSGSIITICNYDEEQKQDASGDTPSDMQTTQQTTHIRIKEQENKNSPLKPPHGGAREKPNLRSLRRQPAPCSCSDSGEVAIRRQGTDGTWEVGYAGCPNCPRGAGRWAVADAVRFGWELSKSQN